MTVASDHRRILEVQNDFREDLGRFIEKWNQNLVILGMMKHALTVETVPVLEFLVGITCAYEFKLNAKGSISKPLVIAFVDQTENQWSQKDSIMEMAKGS